MSKKSLNDQAASAISLEEDVKYTRQESAPEERFHEQMDGKQDHKSNEWASAAASSNYGSRRRSMNKKKLAFTNLGADENQNRNQNNPQQHRERRRTNSFSTTNMSQKCNTDPAEAEEDLKRWNFDYEEDSSSLESIDQD